LVFLIHTELRCTVNHTSDFVSMFISFLYVFPVTMCPSSGETTVFVRHFVFVILCGWLSGTQGGTFLLMMSIE